MPPRPCALTPHHTLPPAGGPAHPGRPPLPSHPHSTPHHTTPSPHTHTQEVKRIQAVPLVIGQFLEMVDSSTGIVGSTTGSNYYVRILSTLNRELLRPSASVALHRHSNALVGGGRGGGGGVCLGLYVWVGGVPWVGG